MCRRIVDASPLLRNEARITANRITFDDTGATIKHLHPTMPPLPVLIR